MLTYIFKPNKFIFEVKTLIKIVHCHTLISSGNLHLLTFGFLAVELNCLTPIVAQSVGFCDVSEGNVKNIQKEGQNGNFGDIF